MKNYVINEKELDFIHAILVQVSFEKQWKPKVFGSQLIEKIEKMRGDK